jgi:N6-adenosine-specific RNA methylase IME4
LSTDFERREPPFATTNGTLFADGPERQPSAFFFGQPHSWEGAMPTRHYRRRIRIDKEFRALIPPLTPGERAQLEENIIAAGRAMDPLVLWGNILLDGHNRLDICMKHRLPFTTTQVKLASRADAKAWIVRRQFGRRNLTPYQRIELALKLEPLIAAQAKANQGRRTDLNQKLGERLNTDRELAKIARLSHMTVHKGRVLAREASAALKAQLRAGEVAIDRAYRDVRLDARREAKVAAVAAQSRTAERLDTLRPVPVILADCPFSYRVPLAPQRRIDNHYKQMSLEELCRLPVSKTATKDAVIFFWCPSALLPDGLTILRAWNFTYTTAMVWVKSQPGIGNYVRQQHELLLIGVRGNLPHPKDTARPSSVVFAKRRKHSEKPDEVYEIIERMYPEYEKRELFARRTRPAWLSWGFGVSNAVATKRSATKHISLVHTA